MLLQKAEARIIELQKLLAEESTKSNKLSENLMMEFQRKEARLMEASTEEHQHELEQAEHRHKTEMHALQIRMATEEKNFLEKQQKLRQMIEESSTRAERANMELENITQQEHRLRRSAEEKVAQTMALLDERDGLITTLKQKIKTLESSMNERAEGVEEAEQEVEELQIENEELHDKIDQLQGECSKLQEKIATLEDETTKLGPLQMELTMVREERDRERAKNHSVVQSTITSHSVLESERDSAVAEVRDLKQLLAAALGDLDIARADRGRLLTANNNLQSALEAFQDERQAEINMVEEQRLEAEAGIKAAHAAAVEIMKQTHAEEIRRVQRVAEENTKKAVEQRDDIMVSFKKLQAENFQTRRSLDEAIHRLQTTQEDVIDRTLMKNILLDWCIMKDKEKRHQVLELMASVLHFTDEEKESVHLTHLDIDSVRSKVVGAIAAPLPPSKAILEQLPGENV
jgi:myosin heavy subunit